MAPDPDNRVFDIRVELKNAQNDPKVAEETVKNAVNGIALNGGETVSILSCSLVDDAA